MATITGSGKFVAIAGSDTQLDRIWSRKLSGVMFGVNKSPYCRISSRYTKGAWHDGYWDSEIVTGTALCIDFGIEPDGNDIKYIPEQDKWVAVTSRKWLYLEFPSLTTIKVGNRVGYTGSIKVARDMTLTSRGMWQTNYKTYNFKCGLLMNV